MVTVINFTSCTSCSSCSSSDSMHLMPSLLAGDGDQLHEQLLGFNALDAEPSGDGQLHELPERPELHGPFSPGEGRRRRGARTGRAAARSRFGLVIDVVFGCV